MNWFRLLNLLRKFPVGDLLDYPKDITNSAACRKWVSAVLNSLEILAELTNSELDDEVVKTVRGVIENDTAWNLIHEIFVKVVNANSPERLQAEDFMELDFAETYGFNPVIIMVIIQAISLILKLLKSRK